MDGETLPRSILAYEFGQWWQHGALPRRPARANFPELRSGSRRPAPGPYRRSDALSPGPPPKMVGFVSV